MAKKNATVTKLPKPRRQDLVRELDDARRDIKRENEARFVIPIERQRVFAEKALRKAGVLKEALALKKAFFGLASTEADFRVDYFLISLINKYADKDTSIYLAFNGEFPDFGKQRQEFNDIVDARFQQLARQIELRTETVEESLALIASFRNEFKSKKNGRK